jgi:hypothetical protein
MLGSDISARELRIRTTNYALTFSQTVEIAADSIIALTSDHSVARTALVWKIYGVAAIYRSVALPDPLMASIDSTGNGKSLFGAQQPLAVEATRFIEGELERSIELSGQKMRPELEDGVRRFAAEHPLNNSYFFRPSPVELLAKYLGQDQVSGLQAVGSMTEMMEQLSLRLNLYTELLPRSGRWQAELMLAELADSSRTSEFMDILNQIEATTSASRSRPPSRNTWPAPRMRSSPASPPSAKPRWRSSIESCRPRSRRPSPVWTRRSHRPSWTSTEPWSAQWTSCSCVCFNSSRS